MAEQTPLLSPSPSTASAPPAARRRTSLLLALATLLLLAAGLSVGLVVRHAHKEPSDVLERAKLYLKACTFRFICSRLDADCAVARR